MVKHIADSRRGYRRLTTQVSENTEKKLS